MRDTDETYHGIQHDESVGAAQESRYRIFVEESKEGPTARATARVLRELRQGYGKEGWSALYFGWGYNGTGTSAAAWSILTDATGVEPADKLREAFAADVLTYLCDEWRLRRGAILRWARGWYAQHGIDVLPPAVAHLLPASPWELESHGRARLG